MLMHNLSIKRNEQGSYNVELDSKPISAYQASMEWRVDEIPRATIKMFNAPEVDTDAYIEFDFTPDTLSEALGIVRSTLKNEPIIYEALLNNVDNMIKDGKTAEDIVDTVLSMVGL